MSGSAGTRLEKINPFAKLCSFGSDISYASDEAERYQAASPAVVDSESARLHSDSLLRTLSSYTAPCVVDRLEATVNVAALQGAGSPAPSPTGFGRRISIAPQRREGERRRQRSLHQSALAAYPAPSLTP